ncbi:MAG TPA: malto-oligosyltrehalose trehalohydrolase [Bryobacteraceae bacterium]|nr:malto-oligosyltrehalose trehalohydrolase [Bryobacteraceae bacterium]
MSFRVWAPAHDRVAVVLEDDAYPLSSEGNGYFSGIAPAVAGSLYRFRLGSGEYADPASRFQPDGPFGWSQVIDPQFQWTDENWRGCKLEGQIIYEMHIGTFSREGTWLEAAAQLAELAAAGITLLEIMPVADFAGTFGWGYDGVDYFAPCRLYGTPNDFRSLVNDAHALGIGVILDVVYNHAGASGNFLGAYSSSYFTDRYTTDWGEAINFDGEHSGPVREFFIANAAYWIDEFHLDGLRLDATQNIYDAGPVHILKEIAQAVRKSGRGRGTIIVAENEPQDNALIRSYGLDGMWNDDFHHSALVALSGRNEAYYTDYSGRAQELLSALKYGFLFQGQRYAWQAKSRGTSSLDLDAWRLVVFLENHDQVANSTRGYRLNRLASPARVRAMTVLLLLAPGTPMLFQGQEFGATNPFVYFADLGPELAELVAKGRAEFMSQFRSYGLADTRVTLADPGARETFLRCKLDFSEREQHAGIYALHKDLIQLRKSDPVFQSRVDGAVLGERTLLVRYFANDGGDRVLLVNLDRDLHFKSVPEPLLAPPQGCRWQVLFSSEHPKYGGSGVYLPDRDGDWNIPGDSATVLSPIED